MGAVAEIWADYVPNKNKKWCSLIQSVRSPYWSVDSKQQISDKDSVSRSENI
jgi:hypothetical protein